MDALTSADVLLLGSFRFDLRNRALFHLDSDAQIPIGSRALGVLGVLIEQPVISSRRTRSWRRSGRRRW